MKYSILKFAVIFCFAFLLSCSGSSKPSNSTTSSPASRNELPTSKVEQPTIPTDLSSEQDLLALRKIKEKAQKDHPDNYSTQKYVYDQQVSAYQYMKTIPASALKSKIEKDHPYNFSTQKYVYDLNVEAKEYMDSLPESSLKAKVQKDHPNNYSTQKYVYNMQMEAKEEMEKK